jgi:hypothetical protein
MFRNRKRWWAIALVGAACGAVATADTIMAYNNFGPGNDGFEYLTGTSWAMGGYLGPKQHAQSFTAEAGGPLTDVYLGIFNVLSGGNVTIRVANNINFAGPTYADILEEWFVASVPGSSGSPVTHLVSQNQPLLDAGENYWLWITVATGTVGWGYAPDSSLSVPRRTRNSDTDAWGALTYGRPGALRVDVVPEPQALVLLLAGLAVFGRRS